MGFCYRYNDPVVLGNLDLNYLQFRLGVVLHAVRISICPLAQGLDIKELVDPLLDDVVIRLDNVILAITRERSGCYPNFVLLTTLEETTANMVTVGLASVRLFGVIYDPVRLGPGFPARLSTLTL